MLQELEGGAPDATRERRVGGIKLANSTDGSVCGEPEAAACNHDLEQRDPRLRRSTWERSGDNTIGRCEGGDRG